MSGFVAAFPTHSRNLPDDSIAAMSERIAHRGPLERILEMAGVASVALRNADHGAYRAEAFISDDGLAIFDGFLWDEEEVVTRFGADSLSEALWRGFTERGVEWLSELDGSFAIVLYDRAGDMFHLARDRFAARPMSYALLDGMVLIGSEIKAFTASPGFPRVINRPVVSALFELGFVPGPETLLEHVYKALPGETATIANRSEIRTALYPIAAPPVDASRTTAALATLVDESLERAVMGYGPSARLGVLLSGGIDSSLIAAKLPARAAGGVRAVSFGDTRWADEESDAAGALAARLGVPFTPAVVGDGFDPLTVLEAAIWHIEEPTRFETAIALEVACGAVAGSVDAIATGEGADLLFGSPTHILARWLPMVWKLPSGLRRTVARRLRGATSTRRARTARYLDTGSLADVVMRSLGWVPLNEDGPHQPELHGRMRAVEGLVGSLPGHVQCTMLELTTAGAPWVERMEQIGAAHGIDVVHPFGRNEMLDHAVSSPYRLKVARAGTRAKPALAALASRTLGDTVAGRRKKQFAAPFQLWLTHSPEIRQAALDLRNEESHYRRYVDLSMVDPILEDFAANGPANRRTRRVVLTLLGFEVWLRRFLIGEESRDAA